MNSLPLRFHAEVLYGVELCQVWNEIDNFLAGFGIELPGIWELLCGHRNARLRSYNPWTDGEVRYRELSSIERLLFDEIVRCDSRIISRKTVCLPNKNAISTVKLLVTYHTLCETDCVSILPV